ncbi:hypothetical protein [Paenibacillus tianjinensis]|uniref:Uncharacterized protein n=1 Tax=Paenibacillus tianjinensis TaxID=2810347 RepID=A0ABX7L9H4_9BACL|nr:hypothetical protein [Paenibacillus tianjinensis]QSF43378.1 hypothetical protein JRJ22_19115 [Paenibacillus tianjinensis]
MFKEYKIRFYDSGEHKLGYLATITALDDEQADEFAKMIVAGLAYQPDSDWYPHDTKYEFI